MKEAPGDLVSDQVEGINDKDDEKDTEGKA
mgnify:CR=1 FL=1